jgi:hypothetical protein
MTPKSALRRVIAARREQDLLASLRGHPQYQLLLASIEQGRLYYERQVERHRNDETRWQAFQSRALYSLLGELLSGHKPVNRCLPGEGIVCSLPHGHPGPHDQSQEDEERSA